MDEQYIKQTVSCANLFSLLRLATQLSSLGILIIPISLVRLAHIDKETINQQAKKSEQFHENVSKNIALPHFSHNPVVCKTLLYSLIHPNVRLSCLLMVILEQNLFYSICTSPVFQNKTIIFQDDDRLQLVACNGMFGSF